MRSSPLVPLPVLSRYLLRQFLGFFIPILVGFVLLYLIVDLFSRMGILLKFNPPVRLVLLYFLFKIPLMVTQVTPPAVIAATLLGLGTLGRSNEIVALRAGGVSLLQTAKPVLGAALLISAAGLLWNETVVPYSSRECEKINDVIRNRDPRTMWTGEIWYRGKVGFYNIDHVDPDTQTLFGMSIFRLDADYQLQGVALVPRALWENGHWKLYGAIEQKLGQSTLHAHQLAMDAELIPEPFEEFVAVQRKPEELSFFELRAWIQGLQEKGIDATPFLVDLYLKLALPFASAVLCLLAIPIGGAARRHTSMASVFGIGLGTGFLYWVVLGLCTSLGQSGVLPAFLAAWAANITFTLVATALFLYAE